MTQLAKLQDGMRDGGSTLAELEQLPIPASGRAVFVIDGDRSGNAVFDTSDLSAEVAADPSQNRYIAPNDDPSGSSGAWVMVLAKDSSASLIGTANGETVEQRFLGLEAGDTSLAWDNFTFPVFAAHRGMEMAFPENTLLAFQETYNAGGKIIEMDVYLTDSGDLICIHDATTSRTVRDVAGDAISIDSESLTSQDLYGLDASFRSNTSTGFFGSDFEFNSPPLLSEVLLEMRGKVAFLIEAKGTNATRIRDCAQAIADLTDRLNLQASVLICSAQPLIDGVFDSKGCKVGFVNAGAKQTTVELEALAASGYYMTIEPKELMDSAYKADISSAGLVSSAYTYAFPEQFDAIPDVPICVDIFVCQEKRLATSQDHLQRPYPGPGYIREGFGGAGPGNPPIFYPVIRTIEDRRFIGWTEAHPLPSGANRFVIAHLDPDPDNDGSYTLDFDLIWTELSTATNELARIHIELDKAGTFQEGGITSVVKNCYLIGFRANGGASMFRLDDVASNTLGFRLTKTSKLCQE